MVKNFIDYINESIDLKIDIEGENNNLIKDIINNLSFIYKKRKNKYLRPKTINGKINDIIEINISMYNNDIIYIKYENNTLRIDINGSMDYYMDNIKKDDIPYKIFNRYIKYIENNNFKVIRKNIIL